MKEKKKRNDAKEELKAGLIWIIGVLLFYGVIISAEYISPYLEEEQFDFYEKIACAVYEQGNQVIIEVPKGVSVKKDLTSITVGPENKPGKIVAKLENGKLVFEEHSGFGLALFIAIFIGLAFVIFYIFLIWICIRIKNKIKS